jgi:glycosyltransferase involved in cell wall biosynthesis
LDKPFDFFWPWFMPKKSKTRFAFMSGGTDFFPGDKWIARHVNILLACSHFNAWQIRSRYKQPVGVVHYGVNTAHFTPQDATLMRAQLGVPTSTVLFVFAGRLVGWKGMAVAVRALAEPVLREISAKLLIIGNGPERSRLDALAHELNVGARLIFHDPVPHDSLPDYYAAADVGVFPSIGDEAFGITIAEAMSCAKPVIASHIGGIPEVVGNEESCGLLVEAGNPRMLAEAMRTLALDSERRARMGLAARQRIEAEFTWAASARRLIEGLKI